MTDTTDNLSTPASRRDPSLHLIVGPVRTVFYTVFFLVFCFSGLLTTLSIVLTGREYYRMGLVSLLAAPLLVLYGIKVDSVFVAYGTLALATLASGLDNGSSLAEVLLFGRILVFSYLSYFLVDLYLRPSNGRKVFRWCIAIAVVQLPIILAQRYFYDHLPSGLKTRIIFTDIGFGTFNYKGDAAMAFFLVMLVILLLFDTKRNFAIRLKWPIVLWLTLTVLVANAELVKLIIALVWAVYIITHFHVRTIIYVTLAAFVLLGTLQAWGFLDQIYENLTHSFATNISVGSVAQSRFLAGRYGRGAAIAYYWSRGLSLLGDGPSAYYNPVDRSRVLGNTGHIFTFYGEVGLVGWLLSVYVFLLIAFPRYRGRRRFTWVSLLSFLAVQLLTFTTQAMNDVSVMLAYCIVTRLYWISIVDQPRRGSC